MGMRSFKEIVGAKVKAARLAKGFSQEELAAAVERSVHSISQIERGINSPSAETLAALSAELGLPIENFLPDQQSAGTKVSVSRQKLVLELMAAVEPLDEKKIEALVVMAKSYH